MNKKYLAKFIITNVLLLAFLCVIFTYKAFSWPIYTVDDDGNGTGEQFDDLDSFIKHQEEINGVPYYGGNDPTEAETSNSTASNTTASPSNNVSGQPQPTAPAKPAHEHTYKSSITKYSTCAEPGVMTYTCECGDTYTEEIPKNDNHKYETEITKEPTCIETGVETYTCSVCGDTYTVDIPTIDHSYKSEKTLKESCTTEGILTYTCEMCGDSYTETIPAGGHDSDNGTIAKSATTFFPGVMEYHCETCGELLKTEVIDSKYPTYYLYIIIGVCGAVVIGIIAAVIIKKKKEKI